MNPNSKNQTWSRWTFTVTPRRDVERPFNFVKANCARFGLKAFGSATQMRVTQRENSWTIDIRTEGHPVNEPSYVTYMEANWRRFFIGGFGIGTEVTLTTKLEAGSRQDGTPSDQLIILPPIAVEGVV
jgi:hypothetical protein